MTDNKTESTSSSKVNEVNLAKFLALTEYEQLAHLHNGLSGVLQNIEVQNDSYKVKSFDADEEEIIYLRKELLELRRMRQKTHDTANGWKQTQDFLNQFEEQLRQLYIKQDPLTKNMPNYNHKYSELRRKSGDLETNLRWLIKFMYDKTLFIEDRIEKFQKRQMAKKEKKKQKDNLAMMKTVELRNTTDKQLTCTARQLEKKDPIIRDKEKQCKEMKQRLSQNSEVMWTVREQGEEMKSLKAFIVMYQETAEKYKQHNEKLADQIRDTNALYLEEKLRNMDLTKVLQENIPSSCPPSSLLKAPSHSSKLSIN
ncbi:hypothetical protein JOB18_006468 [Solea senegalensis]|uniref:Uncharacterized protein n=1 Tax=Solea senegalensis TaxID=28829 RepID=A0AAV6R3B9_SOLSE|nr:hypothetical protein JOB18_006468 [Solea senegalensis]